MAHDAGADEKGGCGIDEEEDHRTLKVSLSLGEADFKGGAPSSPLLKGMDLDLSFAARKTEVNARMDYEGVQEESLLVIFDLPDGSQGESTVSLSLRL